MQERRPVITFSHLYQKLLDEHNDMIESATLLDCTLINLEDLHPAFLTYDTDNGKYSLPKQGQYLQLLFLKPKEGEYVSATNLFTTLRRHTPQKHNYYTSMVGREFEVRYRPPTSP